MTARRIAPLEVAVELAVQLVARCLADETLRAHDWPRGWIAAFGERPRRRVDRRSS